MSMVDEWCKRKQEESKEVLGDEEEEWVFKKSKNVQTYLVKGLQKEKSKEGILLKTFRK